MRAKFKTILIEKLLIIRRKSITAFKLIIISPIKSIFTIPFFFYCQVLKHFLFESDIKSDPIINYNPLSYTSGLFYWYRNAKRIETYGILGFDFTTYLGTPTGIFDFPLSTYLLSKLGYKYLIITSFILLIVSMFFLNYHLNNVNLLFFVIIPCILFSNILWEHVFQGLYEIIGWSFAFLAIAAYYHGNFIIAGIFLGFVGLSHPGILLLSTLSIISITLLTLNNIFEGLFTTGFVSLIICSFWIIPYYSTRHFNSRKDFLNHEGNSEKSGYDFNSIVQLSLYFTFCLTLIIFSNFKSITLLSLLPIIIVIYNFKNWVFSPYTLRFFKLFIGVICLILCFHPISFIVFLFYLYIKPSLLGGDEEWTYFHFRPLRLGTNEKIITNFFEVVDNKSIIAFEYKSQNWNGIYHVAFMGLVLRNSNFQLFNTGISEIYNGFLFHDITKKLNSKNFTLKFSEYISKLNISYITAFSNEFKIKLMSIGYRLIGDLNISELMNSKEFIRSEYLPKNIYLLKMETSSETNYKLINKSKNKLVFEISETGIINLNYQYFFGIYGKLNGENIQLKRNNNNFISFDAPTKGIFELFYSKRKFFINCLENLTKINLK